jgi:hypothetical protein
MTTLQEDIKLLKKYKEGRDVDDSDYTHIKNLCLIGLMNTGISTKRQKITAKPTSTGMGLIN